MYWQQSRLIEIINLYIEPLYQELQNGKNGF